MMTATKGVVFQMSATAIALIAGAGVPRITGGSACTRSNAQVTAP
jgi:hypothetical protein